MKKREENMSLYNDNVIFLKENYPYVKWNEKQKIERNTHEIYVMEDKKSNVVIGVMVENHLWTLGSRYDVEIAAECWVGQFENVNYRTIFIILGIGNGIYIRKLSEKYPDNYIIACEPDTKLFYEYLTNEDIKKDLNENVFLAAGENVAALYAELIDKMVNYDNKKEIIYTVIPNYQMINQQLVLQYRQRYRDRIERLIMARNTIINDENSRAINELKNMFIFYQQYSVGQLYDTIKKMKLEKKVAIVVAAGPSLDKNINDLKKAEGKAFIMVVDTALKTVIKAGIKPNLAITIDPDKDPALFDNEEIRKLPLCVTICGNNQIIAKHQGKLFFPTGDNSFMENLAKKYNKGVYTVPTGGSVANNAFSIVGLMGFKTVILVGQDLAYPNGQVHTTEAYDNEENIDDASTRYYQVEDIYGGKVYTEANMDCYRKWFEEQIKINPQLEVIDATEGGAKIYGSKIMSLREAIQKKCELNNENDYKTIVNPDETMFNEKQKKEIEQYYINVEKKLEELKIMLKQQEENYIELEKLEEKNMSDEYKTVVVRTSEMTKKIEKHELFELARLYHNIVEFRVYDNMNDKNNQKLTESIKASRGGRMVCQTYMENVDKVKKIWHKLLIENKLIKDEKEFY